MNEPSSRRDFLRAASAPVLFAALGISVSACDSQGPDDDGAPDGGTTGGITIQGNQIRIDLSDPAAQKLAGAGGFLSIAAAQAMAVNVDGTTIRAFSNRCTHQQCAIDTFTGGAFVCPCHGSRFSTTGAVVTPPAQTPLPEFSVARSGNVVTITKA